MSKILVIDDEELFRQSAAFALQRKGYATLEAADGVAGLDMARRQLPDLIVCDINMDRMDGYAVLEALRQEPDTIGIPFIFMTGMGDPETMRRGMNLGADDYLAKPFTSNQLYSAVDARLKKHRLIRESAERKLADLRANLSLAMPHEMITPLNGIFGLAQILSSDAETLTKTEVAEYGSAILQSAERLHHTVQNFLLYGQLEMQASDPAAVANLQRQQTPQIRLLIEARARHIAARATREADLHLAVADAAVTFSQDLLIKLTDEILDNAFKFSDRNSPVRVSGAPSSDSYVLAISDKGFGMETAQIAQIGAYAQFERRQMEQQGSGLGLAIARRICELHGATLQLRSEKKKGTTVTVTMRLAAMEAQ